MAKSLTKTCSTCGKTKLISEFYKDITKLDGVRCNCKTCAGKASSKWYYENREKQLAKMREYYKIYKGRRSKLSKKEWKIRDIKYRYGLTWSDYQKMVKQQKNKCAICRKKDTSGRRLSIDHNHKTGKVRGLLCHKCNRALGMIGDSKVNVRRMLEYLER